MKRIFITGATSGIGLATAELLSKQKNKYQLILNGRRKERLENIANTLSKYCNVEIAHFDVRDYSAVKSYFKKYLKDIDVLINNAGLASGRDFIHEADIEDWEKMIDTNVKGLLYVSKEIIPRMIKKQSGHIINIGSVAGKEVYAGGAVYCATKFAVEAITQGLRKELLPHKIKVGLVSPGAVNTEFSLVRYKGDAAVADKVYDGYQPLKAEDIATAIKYSIEAPPHVNIQDIFVMPEAQADGVNFRKN